MLKRYPMLFISSINSLKKKAQYITKDLGLSPKVFRQSPGILGLSHKTLQNKVEYINKNLGFNVNIIEQYSVLLTYSKENMQSIYDYLTGTMGITAVQIKAAPTYLGCSLERVKGCFEYMIKELNFFKDDLDLQKIIFRSVSVQDIKDNIFYLNNIGTVHLSTWLDYYKHPSVLLEKREKFQKYVKFKSRHIKI